MMRKVATVSLLLVCSASLCGAFAPISMGATTLQLGASRGLGLAASRTQSPGHCGAALRMQTQPEERAGGASLSPLTLPAAIAILAPAIAVAAGGDGDVSTSPENLEQIRSTLDISLAILSTLFFIRIPISWYPQMDLTKFPQAIVCAPTEPFLKVVRSITPPLFGVDISPIVIYGILSFFREIFLGQQGLIIMMAGKQG